MDRPALGCTVTAVPVLRPAAGRPRGRRARWAATVLVGPMPALGVGLSRDDLGVHRTVDGPAGRRLDGALRAFGVGAAAVAGTRATEIHRSEGVRPSPLR